MENNTKIRYADLFCGLGAFHEAFKRRPEFECVFACDINEKVRRIYERNHGLAPAGERGQCRPRQPASHEHGRRQRPTERQATAR